MVKKIKPVHVQHIRKMFPNVTNVVNSKEPIRVEVSRSDSQNASSKDPMNCAMARACKRKYKLDGVIISLSTAYLIKGETATKYKVPASLSREVVTFDRSKSFEPGEYMLSRVPPSEMVGYDGGDRRSPHTKKGKKTGPATRFFHKTENVRHFPDRLVIGKEDDQ